MNLKTRQSALVISPYIMAAVIFAGTSLLSQTETKAIGIVTNQDPQIALGGYGGYLIYKKSKQIQALDAELKSEIARISSESNRLGLEAAEHLKEADISEAGRPVPMDETIYSQGRYGSAEAYKENGGASPALKDPKFRVQESDARRLVESLLERQDLTKARDFSIQMTVVDGTLDGRIKTLEKTISGSLKEVTENFVKAVSSQASDTPRGSIVEVTFNWSKIEMPRLDEAKALRWKAGEVKALAEKAKVAEAEKIAEAEKRMKTTLNGLKRVRLASGGVVIAAVLLATIRDGISAEMVTLAQACESNDVMKTQIVSKSIKSGLSEDEVAFELQSACAE